MLQEHWFLLQPQNHVQDFSRIFQDKFSTDFEDVSFSSVYWFHVYSSLDPEVWWRWWAVCVGGGSVTLSLTALEMMIDRQWSRKPPKLFIHRTSTGTPLGTEQVDGCTGWWGLDWGHFTFPWCSLMQHQLPSLLLSDTHGSVTDVRLKFIQQFSVVDKNGVTWRWS